jgi:DNA-binding protein YbaB
VGREIDEAWIDEAVDRYARLEQLRADFDKAVAAHLVSVHSPDNSIEVIVTAAGEIRDVCINVSLRDRDPMDFAREIKSVVTKASEAARWAREKLHGEVFGKFQSLGES